MTYAGAWRTGGTVQIFDDDTRDIAIAPAERYEEVTDLVAMAIDRNLDVDKLRVLVELRNAQDEREAKRRFDDGFARMQADFDTVRRTKKGHDYKYAPIEALQKHYGPIIARHGFSYRWREEAIASGGKRTVLIISGHGHSEENYFDAPMLEGTRAMNAVQVAGAMSTYGRRYTFIAGFGVVIEDEDTDGRPLCVDEVQKLTPAITAISTAKDLDELKDAFSAAWNANHDTTLRKLLTEAKDSRKEELSNG
jgi:hypothetical protein